MTVVAGRIGGQYQLTLLEDQRYKVQGAVNGTPVTVWIGDYETATKIMSYCALHDGSAQTALQFLFYQGDPTQLMQLIEAAKVDEEVKSRRRVGVVIEVVADVLEDENAVQAVMSRFTHATQLTGCRVMFMQGAYIDTSAIPERLDAGRVAAQRDYLLNNGILTPDGTFEFPDGTTLPCMKADPSVMRALEHIESVEREARVAGSIAPKEEGPVNDQ